VRVCDDEDLLLANVVRWHRLAYRATLATRRRSLLMKAHSIAALLRRIDALLERAARARQEMENAKASRAERHLVLTGTRGIWRRNMHAWLRRRGR